MNLHEIIKRNMLRFGTKNLDESAIRLIEQQEPDLMQYDWSKGGTVSWENASIGSIIKYIMARDASEDYSKYAIYTPVMQWFIKNDGPETRKSLMTWCGDDPYYGLGTIGDHMWTGTKFGRPTKETQQEVIDLADRYVDEVVNQLKGAGPLDGQVKAQLNRTAVALRTTAQKGIWIMPEYVSKLDAGLTRFIQTKGTPSTNPKSYTFLPDGGYTQNDVNVATKAASDIITALQSDTKTSQISVAATTQRNIMADNNARAKMLSEIQTQCFDKLKSPTFYDGIRDGKVIKLDIATIVKKADNIYFSKEGDVTVKGASKDVSNKQVTISTPEIIKFSYPPNEVSDADHIEMQKNFFEDDGTSLTYTSATAIEAMVEEIYKFIDGITKQYPNDPVQVQSINIFTYASTSTVNSSYGTGPAFKTLKVFNRENNVKLARDRCRSIIKFADDAINSSLRTIIADNETTIIKNPPQLNPNLGPLWEEVGGSIFGKAVTIEDYGPLFRAAYQEAIENKKKLTPKMFFADRKTSTEKKAEYEATYSPFRVAKVGIAVQLIMPKTLKDQAVEGDYVVAMTSGFEGGISWNFWSWPKIKLPNVKLPKIFKNMPKQTMPVFTGRTIKCTF
jgi:hypothetical protein